jgi:hypothetical protein
MESNCYQPWATNLELPREVDTEYQTEMRHGAAVRMDKYKPRKVRFEGISKGTTICVRSK